MSAQPDLILDGASLSDAPEMVGPADSNMGVYGAAGNAIGFNDALLGRHVLFLGAIGTGKTVGMSALVASMRAAATPDDVFVFFDTKGDYLEAFGAPGDAVVSTDLTAADRVDWNVFADIAAAGGQLEDEVHEVTAALFASTTADAGDHNAMWPKIAQDLFAALTIAKLRAGEPLTNADIRAWADSMTLDDIYATIGPHEDLRGVLQYVRTEGSNTTTSVLIFFQQMVRTTFRAAFARPGNFSVREFLRDKGGRALFLEYDIAAGATVEPVYRTMLDIAFTEALGRRRAKGRVFVVLDEFALLPKLTKLDAGLNFGRSLGMRFVVGTQNVGQVRAAYGEDGGNSILSGFGTVFSFRLYDQASRDFVSGRFGANAKVVRFDSSLKNRGVNESRVEGSVIEDWDITGLDVGQAIVALPDSAPYRFRFAPPAPSIGAAA